MTRISLRNILREDASIIYQWKQDSIVKKMALDETYKTTLEEQIEDIERVLNSEKSDYKIILKDNQPIGYVRIDFMDSLYEMAWLRFALGSDRGKGFAKQALQIYFKTLFKKGVKRLEGEVYAYNIPSQKLLESIGFIREGVKREAHLYQNRYYDIYVYGLLKKDFISDKTF